MYWRRPWFGLHDLHPWKLKAHRCGDTAMACYGYGMHFLKQRLSQAALHGEVILIGDSPRYPFICLLAVYRLVTNYINLPCCKVYKWPKMLMGPNRIIYHGGEIWYFVAWLPIQYIYCISITLRIQTPPEKVQNAPQIIPQSHFLRRYLDP